MSKNLNLSNLEKIYWPEEKITKGDMIRYYLELEKYILPHLKDRPVSMNRFPNGIIGEHFYQKDTANLKIPDWIETVCVSNVNYVLCQNVKTLIYLANLGCIEINVWNSRVGSLEHPDFLVLDLDPVEVEFKEVINVAKLIKVILDKVGLEGFAKTSGASGMHIYIPTGAKYTYLQVKQLGKILATIVHKHLPKISSIERVEKNRIGRVYVDYLQNNIGQTMASPYSVRPVKGALVSTPLDWNEVNENLRPSMFNIKNMAERVSRKRDLFQPVLRHQGFDMKKILKKIEGEFSIS